MQPQVVIAGQSEKVEDTGSFDQKFKDVYECVSKVRGQLLQEINNNLEAITTNAQNIADLM